MAYMTNKEKALQYIKENKNLIDRADFDTFFKEIKSKFGYYSGDDMVREASGIFLEAGINYLLYLKEEMPYNALNFPLGLYETAKNIPLIIPEKFDKIKGDINYRGEVILKHPYEILKSSFIEGEVKILNLTASQNLTKIELGAFKHLYNIDKIILSKKIDKNKLLVNKLDRDYLLERIELR